MFPGGDVGLKEILNMFIFPLYTSALLGAPSGRESISREGDIKREIPYKQTLMGGSTTRAYG